MRAATAAGLELVDLRGGDDGDAAFDRPVVNLALHGRADADLDHPARLEQAFLDGVVEHRAVTVALAERVGPGVDMGIEVNERYRSVAPAQGAQQGQGDAVVAAQRHQMLEPERGFLDPRQAGRDVPQGDREVTDVGERQSRRIDPVDGMRAVHQHPARLPDRRRAEPGAAAVGGAEIERNAGDADRGVAIPSFDAEEGRRDGVGRRCRHGGVTGGIAKRNTAAATAQVQSPLGAPSAAAVIERLSTMRSLSS